MKQITIRKLGARLLGDSESTILQSMRQQNRLWNKLVEIERANTEAYRQIVTDSDAELAAITKEHQAVEEQLEEVRIARNRARAAKRAKALDNAPDYAAAIKTLAARLKDLRVGMKACRARAKEAAAPRLQQLEEGRRAVVKAAAQEADLWWAHSELVLGAYDVARVRALKTNGTLRFRRFEGEGRIGVRFANGIQLSAPPATGMLKVREPTSDELGVLQATRSKKRIVAVDMRVGKPGEEKTPPIATFLVTVHAGAELLLNTPLKSVVVKRENHAGRGKWFMVFMFVDADADPIDKPLPARAVGVDFGFRMVRSPDVHSVGDDARSQLLRVATVVGGDGAKEHITLPSDLVGKFHHAAELRGELDRIANDFWLAHGPLFTEDVLGAMSKDEWLRVLVQKAKRARQPYASLMLSIVRAHAEQPVLGEAVNNAMAAWGRRARRLTVATYGTRRRAVERRNHLFRNAAARLVAECGFLALKNTAFAALARLVSEDGSTENPLHAAARANRVIASPALLRAAIVQAAKREQRELVLVDPKDTTLECSQCGHRQGGPIADLMFVCYSCHTVHDQDENSALICLKRALESNA